MWQVAAQAAPESAAVSASNAQIFAEESGALIAEGTLRPLGVNHSLTIATPNPAWLERKLSFSTSRFYEKAGAPPEGMAPPTDGSFQIDRYDTRFTKAFWNTAVPSTMPIRDDGNFTEKTWANPQEAVVHLYQTEYWGIWMFQLESVNLNRGRGSTSTAAAAESGGGGANASMTFSRGGWQEARGGSNARNPTVLTSNRRFYPDKLRTDNKLKASRRVSFRLHHLLQVGSGEREDAVTLRITSSRMSLRSLMMNGNSTSTEAPQRCSGTLPTAHCRVILNPES